MESRNLYRIQGSCGYSLLALKGPPREKMFQMAGKSHLDKHCEY
jgi:hypothetical protein